MVPGTSSLTERTRPLKFHCLLCSHLSDVHSEMTGTGKTKAGLPRREAQGGQGRGRSYTAADVGNVSGQCAVTAPHTEALGRGCAEPGKAVRGLACRSVPSPLPPLFKPSTDSLPDTGSKAPRSCSHPAPYGGLCCSPHFINGDAEALRCPITCPGSQR